MELETRLVAELRQTTLPEYVLSFALLWITSDFLCSPRFLPVQVQNRTLREIVRKRSMLPIDASDQSTEKDFVNRLGASDQLPEGATK